MQETESQVEDLRQMYTERPALRPFFDDLATYVYDRKSIKIDVVHRRIGGKRVAVVAAFKLLAEIGLGAYVKGSWGHASRFDFAGTTPKRVGLLAQGVEDEDELPDLATAEDDTEQEEFASLEAEGGGIYAFSIEDLVGELKRRGAREVTILF